MGERGRAQGDDSKKGNSRSPSGMTTRKATARVFSGETNVNSRGPTTFLWIKHLFGFCGELW
jgi:hypothetical protein